MTREMIKIFQPFLWSYDLSKMDLEKDKDRIICNILNYGTKEATDLLFRIYDKQAIRKVVKNPRPGEWNKKSLNYWSIVFDLKPNYVLRHIG